jgi:hypothetical protein
MALAIVLHFSADAGRSEGTQVIAGREVTQYNELTRVEQYTGL